MKYSLKPCPFHKKYTTPEIRAVNISVDSGYPIWGVTVMCPKCGVAQRWDDEDLLAAEGGAIDKWNERYTGPETPIE